MLRKSFLFHAGGDQPVKASDDGTAIIVLDATGTTDPQKGSPHGHGILTKEIRTTPSKVKLNKVTTG